MQRIHWIVLAALAIVCLTAFVFAPAWEQDAQPVIAPSSPLYDVWNIVQPVVVLFVSTVGPVLVTWISARLIALLKVTDEKQRADIEAKLRQALHQSAANAMSYAAHKIGVSLFRIPVSEDLLRQAAAYVTEKNPEALEKLGVSQQALRDILLSKVTLVPFTPADTIR